MIVGSFRLSSVARLRLEVVLGPCCVAEKASQGRTAFAEKQPQAESQASPLVWSTLSGLFMALLVELRDVPIALLALWYVSAAEPKNRRLSRCSECKIGIEMA